MTTPLHPYHPEVSHELSLIQQQIATMNGAKLHQVLSHEKGATPKPKGS
jgi:hypothetical protein